MMWYYQLNHCQHGPTDAATIKDLLTQQMLTRDSQVWTEGMSAWRRLAETELASLLPTQVPPPLRPPESDHPSYDGGIAPEPVRLQLWNPDVAANWSLLLTPAFGAYLHATNWRTLGKPKGVTANMVWVGVTVAFLALNLGMLFVPDFHAMAGIMQMVGLGLLCGWYFSQGRPQAQYVKATLRRDYIKKGWGRPLLAGFAAVGVYTTVVFLIATAASHPDPNALAAAVKPLILQEWHKRPALQGLSIQDIALVHKGGKVYTGFVETTRGGQSERLVLEVVFDGHTIAWEVKPLGGK
jgi:GYF domain 2